MQVFLVFFNVGNKLNPFPLPEDMFVFLFCFVFVVCHIWHHKCAWKQGTEGGNKEAGDNIAVVTS